MSRIGKLQRMNARERRDLLPAAWRLLVARLMLTLLGIKRTQQRLGGGQVTADGSGSDLASWRRRALAMRRVAAVMPATRCLARAMALRWWMRSAGLDARLKLGVRRDQGQTHSHAWVECAGKPIDDPTETVAQFRVVEWAD